MTRLIKNSINICTSKYIYNINIYIAINNQIIIIMYYKYYCLFIYIFGQIYKILSYKVRFIFFSI